MTSGAEIARRLEVDRRTVRRYIAALQALGIPVRSERGVAGGYRLGPGFRLPPLMLREEEAVAVVLGLAAAGRLGLGPDAPRELALGKLRRVLPAALRQRVDALDHVLAFTLTATTATGEAAPGARLLDLAEAVHRRRRLALRYRASDGAPSRREVSPHGLVAHAGRWYLVAHDHGRDAARTFRVDRIDDAARLATAAAPAPEGFDAAEHVTRAFARLPWQWEVEVLLDLPVADARRRVPPTLAELEGESDGTRLTMRADDLDFAAAILAGLRCAFTIRRPPELAGHVRALAGRLLEHAGPAP